MLFLILYGLTVLGSGVGILGAVNYGVTWKINKASKKMMLVYEREKNVVEERARKELDAAKLFFEGKSKEARDELEAKVLKEKTEMIKTVEDRINLEKEKVQSELKAAFTFKVFDKEFTLPRPTPVQMLAIVAVLVAMWALFKKYNKRLAKVESADISEEKKKKYTKSAKSKMKLACVAALVPLHMCGYDANTFLTIFHICINEYRNTKYAFEMFEMVFSAFGSDDDVDLKDKSHKEEKKQAPDRPRKVRRKAEASALDSDADSDDSDSDTDSESFSRFFMQMDRQPATKDSGPAPSFSLKPSVFVPSTTSTTPGDTGPQPYFCDVCEVRVSGPDVEKHEGGALHKKRLKNSRPHVVENTPIGDGSSHISHLDDVKENESIPVVSADSAPQIEETTEGIYERFCGKVSSLYESATQVPRKVQCHVNKGYERINGEFVERFYPANEKRGIGSLSEAATKKVYSTVKVCGSVAAVVLLGVLVSKVFGYLNSKPKRKAESGKFKKHSKNVMMRLHKKFKRSVANDNVSGKYLTPEERSALRTIADLEKEMDEFDIANGIIDEFDEDVNIAQENDEFSDSHWNFDEKDYGYMSNKQEAKEYVKSPNFSYDLFSRYIWFYVPLEKATKKLVVPGEKIIRRRNADGLIVGHWQVRPPPTAPVKTVKKKEKAKQDISKPAIKKAEQIVLGHAIHPVPFTYRIEKFDQVDLTKPVAASNCVIFGDILYVPRHTCAGAAALKIGNMEVPLKCSVVNSVSDTLAFQVPSQKLTKNAYKFRHPLMGETVSFYFYNGSRMVSSDGIVGDSTFSADGKCEMVEYISSTVDASCGGIYIASSDGCCVGIHGVGGVGSNNPRFYPFSAGFEEEHRKLSSGCKTFPTMNLESDAGYVNSWDVIINGGKSAINVITPKN